MYVITLYLNFILKLAAKNTSTSILYDGCGEDVLNSPILTAGPTTKHIILTTPNPNALQSSDQKPSFPKPISNPMSSPTTKPTASPTQGPALPQHPLLYGLYINRIYMVFQVKNLAWLYIFQIMLE